MPTPVVGAGIQCAHVAHSSSGRRSVGVRTVLDHRMGEFPGGPRLSESELHVGQAKRHGLVDEDHVGDGTTRDRSGRGAQLAHAGLESVLTSPHSPTLPYMPLIGSAWRGSRPRSADGTEGSLDARNSTRRIHGRSVGRPAWSEQASAPSGGGANRALALRPPPRRLSSADEPLIGRRW